MVRYLVSTHRFYLSTYNFQAKGSPTKQLILKYDTGVIRQNSEAERKNSLANRRTNTKSLIKKWNNPEKLQKLSSAGPVAGGFQVKCRHLH